MTPSYLPDLEPTVRELTPPDRRGPAPRRARSYPPELTACASCGGPLEGASYGGACGGCAAADGDQDALVDRLLEAVERELSRPETFALVRAAEDRGLALTVRVAALGRLIVHANPTTAASAGHALNVLKRDGRVPSCFAPTGELSPSVRSYLADAGHELPPDPVELERVEEAERRPYPPHALNYLRPTSPVWSCPRCGGPTRSANAPTCADRHPRETMELVEPGEPGGELVRASDIEHARQLAASAEQGFLYLTGLQLDAVRRLVELWRRVREGWDGPPPPLPRETPGLRVRAGTSYLTPELERELPELIALAERVRRSS